MGASCLDGGMLRADGGPAVSSGAAEKVGTVTKDKGDANDDVKGKRSKTRGFQKSKKGEKIKDKEQQQENRVEKKLMD